MISTVHVSKTTSTTAHAPELQPIGRMIAQEQPPSRSNPASPAKQRSAACLTWCRAPRRIAWHTQRSRTGCASEYAWRAPVNRWCSPAPTCSRPTDCTSARRCPVVVVHCSAAPSPAHQAAHKLPSAQPQRGPCAVCAGGAEAHERGDRNGCSQIKQRKRRGPRSSHGPAHGAVHGSSS